MGRKSASCPISYSQKVEQKFLQFTCIGSSVLHCPTAAALPIAVCYLSTIHDFNFVHLYSVLCRALKQLRFITTHLRRHGPDMYPAAATRSPCPTISGNNVLVVTMNALICRPRVNLPDPKQADDATRVHQTRADGFEGEYPGDECYAMSTRCSSVVFFPRNTNFQENLILALHASCYIDWSKTHPQPLGLFLGEAIVRRPVLQLWHRQNTRLLIGLPCQQNVIRD